MYVHTNTVINIIIFMVMKSVQYLQLSYKAPCKVNYTKQQIIATQLLHIQYIICNKYLTYRMASVSLIRTALCIILQSPRTLRSSSISAHKRRQHLYILNSSEWHAIHLIEICHQWMIFTVMIPLQFVELYATIFLKNQLDAIYTCTVYSDVINNQLQSTVEVG